MPPTVSPSHTEPLVTNVSNSTYAYIEDHWKHYLLWYVIPSVILSVVIAAGVAYAGYKYYGDLSMFYGDFIFAALPFLIVIDGAVRVNKRMEKLFYSELATTLNATYSPTASTPTTGQLFTFGHDQALTNVLSMTYKGMPFRIGEYQYTVGYGKGSHTDTYVVAEITTPAFLPHIICISFFQFQGIEISWKPSGFTALKLEGDFNKKFAVYVAEGTEVEALEVLEPDVMLKLMEEFGDFGFECVQERVYLMKEGRISEDRDRIMQLLQLVEKFADTLLVELQSFLPQQAVSE